MAWSEEQHRVTRSFNDWFLIDREQRAFLRVGLRLVGDAYQRIWDEVGSRPSYGHDDHVEEFEKEVDGLWDYAYNWMHCAAVVRDAVTNFEVYLEKTREEILRMRSVPLAVPDRGPDFHEELKPFFVRIGCAIDTPPVQEARNLRHFLAHRRGELRTATLRQRFGETSDDPFAPFEVPLDEHRVIQLMDDLGTAARAIDAVAYEHTWGPQPLPHLGSPTLVAGVDGYRGGWVMVSYDAAGSPSALVAEQLGTLLAVEARAIAVDVPIGIPTTYGRPADTEARRFVGQRRSSVFPTPPRAVLEAPNYEEANRRSRALVGKGVSKQSFALRHRILEVDQLAERDGRIIEVHPEVSFCELAGSTLEHSKRSAAGIRERKRLLRRAGVRLPEPPAGVPEADLLDAAVAAWSAERFANDSARSFPSNHVDRIVAIWR